MTEKTDKEKLKKLMEDYLSVDDSEIDDTGVLHGSDKAITSSDSDAFPDELEEYKPSDKKLKRIK